MAPMYMQIRVMIALLASILNVRVVSSATPMVAVRPGSMPMMMPSQVLHTTESRMSHCRKPSRASPNMRSPSMTASLGKIDEEQVLERDEYTASVVATEITAANTGTFHWAANGFLRSHSNTTMNTNTKTRVLAMKCSQRIRNRP